MERFLTKKRPAEGDETAEAKRHQAAVDPDVEALFESLTEPSWRAALQKELSKPYMKSLAAKVKTERASHKVFPPQAMTFACLNMVPLHDVRVVILGQDPYHNDGQAHGLCFSVPDGITTPPSLKNIYKELAEDIPGFKPPSHGNLEPWAKQGILLLNASLTVRAHNANSHAQFGWQTFTDAVVKAVNDRTSDVVFILWGGFAQKKGKGVISRSKHHVLEAAHPSPLSVTKFLGCKVFSKTNAFLEKRGKKPIDWSL